MDKKSKHNVRFLITGGHLTPALAVIEELKNEGYHNLVWVGRKRTMEGDKALSNEYLVVQKDLGIHFENIFTGKIIRFGSLKSFFEFIINIIKIPCGLVCALLILLKHRPSMIISFGGYVAVPIIIVAWLLRIPTVTHEQTVVSGIANKVIAKFAKRIFVSWESSAKHFPKQKVIFTGNPVRDEVQKVITNDFVVNENLKTIYITGGNQGAHIINKVVIKIISQLLEKYNVIHQTGITTITRDFETCDRIAKTINVKSKGTYIVRGSIFGAEIGEVFDKADLIISRAGANTITELLALGKTGILIPIPWSIHNEQLKNAEMLKKLGLAEIIEEKDLNEHLLLETIETAMKNARKGKDFKGNSLNSTIKKAKKMVKLDAAEKIVKETLKIIKSHDILK